MKHIAQLFCGLAFALVAGCGDSTSTSPDPVDEPTKVEAPTPPPPSEPVASLQSADWKQQLAKPELMTFAPGETVFWDLSTNVGDMRFKLFPETAPMHVTSTIFLTEQGFYDGVIFHRVIPGFMAQGGDPTGTGRGGPGYMYEGEFADGVTHDRPGLLSMANAGPGTDGSQFFITFVPTQYLDGKHTLFGELVEGTDTLTALEQRGSRNGQTSERLEIIKAKITRQKAD
jgi:peptidyl-prolyl cis-trans isomerase B (cyclophilin B)